MERTKIQNDQVFMLNDEVYSNDIIPSLKNEMWRNVDLMGEVQIKGAIFGKNLIIDTKDIFIEKAVYVEDSISINGLENSKLWFNSVVNANNSILVNDNSKTRIRFSNNIKSQVLNISNSIIYGNIYCNEAILNNCVVIGAVFAKNRIELKNSIVGTYKCLNIDLYGNIGIIFPFALSNNEPTVNGNIYNVFPKSFSKNKMIGIYEIDNQEIYRINEENQTKFALSSTLRIFDLSNFYNSIVQNLFDILGLTTMKIEDYQIADKNLKELDDLFFAIIENKFQNDEISISNFVNIPQEVLENSQKIDENSIPEHVFE